MKSQEMNDIGYDIGDLRCLYKINRPSFMSKCNDFGEGYPSVF